MPVTRPGRRSGPVKWANHSKAGSDLECSIKVTPHGVGELPGERPIVLGAIMGRATDPPGSLAHYADSWAAGLQPIESWNMDHFSSRIEARESATPPTPTPTPTRRQARTSGQEAPHKACVPGSLLGKRSPRRGWHKHVFLMVLRVTGVRAQPSPLSLQNDEPHKLARPRL
jgi:hypothetical protein